MRGGVLTDMCFGVAIDYLRHNDRRGERGALLRCLHLAVLLEGKKKSSADQKCVLTRMCYVSYVVNLCVLVFPVFGVIVILVFDSYSMMPLAFSRFGKKRRGEKREKYRQRIPVCVSLKDG